MVGGGIQTERLAATSLADTNSLATAVESRERRGRPRPLDAQPAGRSWGRRAGRAIMGFLLHDILPAACVWALHVGEQLDLFGRLIHPQLHVKLGPLALFLGMGAAVVTAESFTRWNWHGTGESFRVSYFLATVAVLGLALFPFLADWDRMLSSVLAPKLAAVGIHYAYLLLKLTVGVLVGGIISWLLRWWR